MNTEQGITIKDTEAPICDSQMPEVNPEIIRWHVCLTVTVDGYWVDMIGVTISKDSPGSDFYHQIHGFQYRHLPKNHKTQTERE